VHGRIVTSMSWLLSPGPKTFDVIGEMSGCRTQLHDRRRRFFVIRVHGFGVWHGVGASRRPLLYGLTGMWREPQDASPGRHDLAVIRLIAR
jgi:hypothetical protein